MSLSEQEFRVKSDEALDAARHALLPLSDTDGFEVELQNGVLNLVFEEPVETKFVVSPNAPVPRSGWRRWPEAINSRGRRTRALSRSMARRCRRCWSVWLSRSCDRRRTHETHPHRRCLRAGR